MNKKLITIIVIVVIAVLIVVVWPISIYNGMVESNQKVEESWGQVESNYQRRDDLISNLVNTVKGYAAHEKETLDAVTSARAKATSITIDPTNVTPEQLAQYQNAQGELSQALGKLLAVSENYPDLKANTNFLKLQDQLEGTENRINTARSRFNESVKEYNSKIMKFPANMFAGMFGFEKKAYFEADKGAEKAPEVKF